MTDEDLREIQRKIKFNAPSMALCLGIKYRTYRNYYYGMNRIPEHIAVKVLDLEQKNNEFIAGIPARVDYHVNKQFPNGLMSEVSPE